MEDWEVVIESSGTTQEEEEEENPKSLEEIEDGTQDGSVQSGSPGWIEPTSDAPYGPKLFSELWSDSSSDRLDDVNNNELGLEKSEEYSKSIAKEKHLDKHTEREEESPVSVQGKSVSGGGGEERVFVWWKIPIDVLKYCVFRVNPLWSFSMAAAVVGFVMLGRRLYHMKKSKSSTLQLKVLLDDKKVASHAARLNEAAISLVKRVPIIRPALPSSVVGMNQWSMMSLR